MANANSTEISSGFMPIIIIEGKSDEDGMTVGELIKSNIFYPTLEAALESAKTLCFSTPGSIGFTIKEVSNNLTEVI